MLNLVPGKFTPSKVSYVLDQAMPKLLLDAMRELIRPQVLPSGIMLIPHPQSFINLCEWDPRAIVRNGVPLDDPDQRLLEFGIQWFPRLSMCFRASWMTGTEDENYALKFLEGVKREGLEPAKGAFVIRIIDKAEWDKGRAAAKKKSAEGKGPAPTESKMEKKDDFVALSAIVEEPKIPKAGVVDVKDYLKYRKLNEWTPAYDLSKLKGSVFSNASCVTREVERDYVREYYCHDFDAVSDAQRDFAFRILRPHIIYLYDDVYIGRRVVVNDMYPDDLLFMGIDIWRGALMYSIHEFQSTVVELMDGDVEIEAREFYVSRWISQLGMALKDWHFPSQLVPDSLEPVDGKSGVQIGQGRRARRNRRSPMPPAEQKVQVALPPVAPVEPQLPAMAAPPAQRGRGRGRGRGFRRGRQS
jgi:hypothetical protein